MFGYLLSTFRIQNFRVLAQKLKSTSTNNPTSAIQIASFLPDKKMLVYILEILLSLAEDAQIRSCGKIQCHNYVQQ